MCWVISTGARSIDRADAATISAVSACGPPVEEPITSTRGGVIGNGRSVNSPMMRRAGDDTAA